jgi:hypothetical protein
VCALGSISKPEPINITNKKLSANNKGGATFTELIKYINRCASVIIKRIMVMLRTNSVLRKNAEAVY